MRWPNRLDFLVQIWVALAALLILLAVALWPSCGHLLVGQAATFSMANAQLPADAEQPATPFITRLTPDEIGGLGGRGETISCSLPAALDTVFNDREKEGDAMASVNIQFRQACLRHDYCYRHGAATYGYTQSYCDQMLAEEALRLCSKIYSSPANLAICQSRARRVLGGVVFGGATAFRKSYFPGQHEDGSDRDSWNGAVQDRTLRRSTWLEYDPYPSGQAWYYTSRMFPGGCSESRPVSRPMLFTYWGRARGRQITTRCLYGNGLAAEIKTLGLNNEATFATGSPWIQDVNGLTYWCRDANNDNPTGGKIVFAPSVQAFDGCPRPNDAKRRPALPAKTATTLYPVPPLTDSGSKSQSSTLAVLGIPFSGDCNAQLTDVKSGNQLGSDIGLPDPPGSTDHDCYRWLVNAPQFVPTGPTTTTALFFRRGTSDGSAFAESLDVFETQIDGQGQVAGAESRQFHLCLGEERDPFIALPPQAGGSISLLSVVRRYGTDNGNASWDGHQCVRERKANYVAFWIIAIAFAAGIITFILSRGRLGAMYATSTTRHRFYYPGVGIALGISTIILAGWAAVATYAFSNRGEDEGGPVDLIYTSLQENDGGKAVTWSALPYGLTSATITPAHFIQNRMSIVRDANGGALWLIATYVGVAPTSTPSAPLVRIIIAKGQLHYPVNTGTEWQPTYFSADVPYIPDDNGAASPLNLPSMILGKMVTFSYYTAARIGSAERKLNALVVLGPSQSKLCAHFDLSETESGGQVFQQDRADCTPPSETKQSSPLR